MCLFRNCVKSFIITHIYQDTKNRDSLKENKLKNRSRKENEFLWVARARHEEHYMQVM